MITVFHLHLGPQGRIPCCLLRSVNGSWNLELAS